jgi:RNA polymerase sigma-70 factor (ECF subfamily)
VEAVIYALMSEAVDPGLELLETQNRFVSDHLRRIFVQIYRIVGNVADAQDLTQEAFIKALQRQEQLKDEQKAAHWLSRIATNTAIDFLRRSGRVSYCELDAAPESHDESPEDILLRSEQRDYLEDGLRLLTARERAALMLRDVEGLPAEEVARGWIVPRPPCGRTSPTRALSCASIWKRGSHDASESVHSGSLRRPGPRLVRPPAHGASPGRCRECRGEVQAFASARDNLVALDELPAIPGTGWPPR